MSSYSTGLPLYIPTLSSIICIYRGKTEAKAWIKPEEEEEEEVEVEEEEADHLPKSGPIYLLKT